MDRNRSFGKVAIGVAAALGLVATAALVIAGVTGPSSGVEAAPEIREIVLSAKDYRFNGSNPPLEVRPGETVRITIQNDETDGTEHNFRIVGLQGACDTAIPPGHAASFVVTIPEDGEYSYTCCAHPGMGGKVVLVRDR